MKKIDLGQAISITANIGVIIGIVFLAVEISQSNRIAAYTAENTRRALYAELNSNFLVSPELVSLGVKLRDKNPVLTAEEEVQAGFLLNRYFNAWANSEEAHRSGLLSEFSWQSTLADVDAAFEKFPGLALVARRQKRRETTGLEILDRIYENVERIEN